MTALLPPINEPLKDSDGSGYEFIQLSALAPVARLLEQRCSLHACQNLEPVLSRTADVSSSRTGISDGHSGLADAV